MTEVDRLFEQHISAYDDGIAFRRSPAAEGLLWKFLVTLLWLALLMDVWLG